MTSTLEQLAAEASGLPRTTGSTVQRLLHAVRTQLGMDVAWTSEFLGSEQVFRYVDAAPGAAAPVAGSSAPLSGSYCARVLDGRLTGVVPDARHEPLTALLDGTSDLHIGAYVGVQLRAPDGTVAGMLCTASRRAVPTLGDRDLQTMRLLADLLHDLQVREMEDRALEAASDELRRDVQRVVDGHGRWPVLQPVVRATSGRVVAYEGLTQFAGSRTPAQWFEAAHRSGLGCALETAAAVSVLDVLRSGRLGDATVCVNLSPQTVVDADLEALLAGTDPRRVVLEVTEHAVVEDYDLLRSVLAPWRAAGLRLAVDDTGAGYASLQHVLLLAPEVVKLDMALVRGVGEDPVRRALVRAVVDFTRGCGMVVVAEGVETECERDALVGLGVDLLQGYLLGRPSREVPAPPR